MRVLLIVYDNASYISPFPLGVAQLAAVLEKGGHEVTLFLQDIHHLPDSAITELLDEERFDMVGLSFIGGYWQYRRALAISEAVNRSRQRPFYVLGGHGPSPEPEYFLKKTGADAVCIGEGDVTILDLCAALSEKRALSSVAGLAYMEDGVVRINKRRELIVDIDALPMAAYHLFPMEVYRLQRMPNCLPTDFVIPILSGRGCPFRCNFCYRMDKGFRPRSNDAIIDEIMFLKEKYGITYIAFFDELLMSSVERTTLLCEEFIKKDIDVKWDCNGRLNYANAELLKLMKRAGCVFINYGIEAFDDSTLKIMHKGLTTHQIEIGIEATLQSGISPGLNIIFGNIGEDKKTLQQGVDFLLKYDDGAQIRTIRPVTPYPGCELYYKAIELGLLKDCADFYENKHINSDLLSVNFTNMSDDEFYCALMKANEILLDNYHMKLKQKTTEQLKELYLERDASFRGFRHT